MTAQEVDTIRRLEGFRRDDLLAGIALAVSRIGGGTALLAAVTEAQSERCRRLAIKRHSRERRIIRSAAE